jgi:predicted AlkP superfamily pyrophosphatase or phosphodiesterase
MFKPFAASILVALAPLIAQAQNTPRLVLQITVDQLRADLIEKYSDGYGDGGFNWLKRNGVVYANAHQAHANTETIVGHTTLATGADPSVHGMVANLWFDRKTGQQVYNVQDADYPLVGVGPVDKSAEIDSTQAAATTDGRSPRNILTTTISDEIAMRFGPESKVFGVSVKDRGAIAMAGHAGQAYWFSKSDARFVTSQFYRDDYPDWIAEWQARGKIASYAGTNWTTLRPQSSYRFGDRDDQPWETDFGNFGRTFPHPYGPADDKYYTTLLTLSPAGDEITVDFAKALMQAEQLGQDEITDFMSVSLSSTDYIGHIFGPSSLEAEDNLKRVDAQIADLLDFVNRTVGLDKTLIVLSADHGAAENPNYTAQFGVVGGLFDFKGVDKEPGYARLRDEFGTGAELIANYSNPYIYLDRALIRERGLDPLAVEIAVAEEVQKMPGIAYAIASTALRTGNTANTRVTDAVLRNFNPDRSGDIYVVFEPGWFVADFDGLVVAATHGSPWAYDSNVPLIFAGPGIARQRVTRRVETVQVAPTMAVYLGTALPSGSEAETLPEITRSR